MSKYEFDRADARKVLINRLLEIDKISDAEIDEHKTKDSKVSLILLTLSKLTRTDRAFRQKMQEKTNAVDASNFLYGKDGMPS